MKTFADLSRDRHRFGCRRRGAQALDTFIVVIFIASLITADKNRDVIARERRAREKEKHFNPPENPVRLHDDYA